MLKLSAKKLLLINFTIYENSLPSLYSVINVLNYISTLQYSYLKEQIKLMKRKKKKRNGTSLLFQVLEFQNNFLSHSFKECAYL